MTIYDIAKEAGVSAATVSRVINNKSVVKEETREKIQKILDKHNFEASETARGLVNQSNKMIGILISDIRNQHYIDGAYIIERDFLSRGYCSIIMNTGVTDEEKASYIRILASRRVNGVVLVGSTFGCEAVRQAIKTYMPATPIVIENGVLGLPNVSEIMADEYNGVKDAVKYLYSTGKRHIAFVNGNDTPSNLLKLQGYQKAAEELGLEEITLAVSDLYDSGVRAAGEIMSKHCEVDGIVFAVDILAMGAVRYLLENGIKIPEDVAVFGLNNSYFSEFSYPKISSIDNKLVELSKACVKILERAIDEQGYAEKLVIPSELVLKETTGKVE